MVVAAATVVNFAVLMMYIFLGEYEVFYQIIVLLARAARRIGLVVSIHAILITGAIATSGSTDRRKERIEKLLHTNVGSEASEWVTLLYHGSISVSIFVAALLMFVKSSQMSRSAGVQSDGLHNALVVIGALVVALLATRDFDPSTNKPDWWIVLYAAPVFFFGSLDISKIQDLRFVTFLWYGVPPSLFLVLWITDLPPMSTREDWQSLKTISYVVNGFWIFLVLCAWLWWTTTKQPITVEETSYGTQKQPDTAEEVTFKKLQKNE